ncbi:MAG TPA: 3-isopropylmalate dehydratase small subunit [Gemmatimonadaceae bacterium]|nr:3-isopropylmalate dehydratase small subunit [Gemmatimonadaceae bacterium]
MSDTITPVRTIESPYVVLDAQNVDTDQIIPARFLKVTDRAGLGDALFADWRYDEDGSPRADFVLNRPESSGAEILVAGHNFGCGSSREHAPWALRGYGFRAVVSTRFADIFHSNALKNGLLPVTIPGDVHERLVSWPASGTRPALKIDLASETLTLPDATDVRFSIESFAKHCLLEGVDELGYLLNAASEIADYEEAHP